jgi:hypothetical protein
VCVYSYIYEEHLKSSRNVAISLYYVKTMIYKLNRLGSIFHLHTHICSVYLVVTLMKIFFFDHAQSRVSVFCDVLNRSKTTSLKTHFQLREEPEVTLCEDWGIGRVWHNRNVVFGQELLN